MIVKGRLPVTWVGTSMIVAERTLIKPPYTVDSVVSVEAAMNGNTEDAANTHVARVKYVVCLLLYSSLTYSCKRSGQDWD